MKNDATDIVVTQGQVVAATRKLQERSQATERQEKKKSLSEPSQKHVDTHGQFQASKPENYTTPNSFRKQDKEQMQESPMSRSVTMGIFMSVQRTGDEAQFATDV